MIVAASLHALLEHSLDYAGLFPPTNLALEPALQNHAQYVRSPESWMVSGFVLPVGQFETARAQLSQFDQKHPLRVCVLGAKTEKPSDFSAALKQTVSEIREFSAQNGTKVSMAQLEMPLPPDADVDLLNSSGSILGQLKLKTFLEAPAEKAERTISMLAEHRMRAMGDDLGFKLRTGGVTEDAFPDAEQIATALVSAAKHRVPIKFTAGLHHPLRKFQASANTKMHGFLNVLGAGILAAEHGWEESPTIEMLEDEDPASFSFDAISFAWREWEITTDRIKARRRLVTSFGSCSFEEPLEDLRALKFF